MKLTIVITHYNEPVETCRPLFESLALQQGITSEDVEILLVQDGKQKEDITELLVKVPYETRFIEQKHGGISKARNTGLDNAAGDYIMWCDADDMFHSLFGLHLIFSGMNEGADIITSTFIEENKYVAKYKLISRENDTTFVHGKVFKVSYLKSINLRFREDLHKHEDGCFVATAFSFTENRKTINTPFYLWRWNDNSVMRKNGISTATLDSYSELVDARDAFFQEILKRDPNKDISAGVARFVFDAYYDFNKIEFNKQENQQRVLAAALAFKRFYEKYKPYYKKATAEDLVFVAHNARTNAVNNGMPIERFTLQQFLNYIAKLDGKPHNYKR